MKKGLAKLLVGVAIGSLLTFPITRKIYTSRERYYRIHTEEKINDLTEKVDSLYPLIEKYLNPDSLKNYLSTVRVETIKVPTYVQKPRKREKVTTVEIKGAPLAQWESFLPIYEKDKKSLGYWINEHERELDSLRIYDLYSFYLSKREEYKNMLYVKLYLIIEDRIEKIENPQAREDLKHIQKFLETDTVYEDEGYTVVHLKLDEDQKKDLLEKISKVSNYLK